jgi:putative ABC transport system permease protein
MSEEKKKLHRPITRSARQIMSEVEEEIAVHLEMREAELLGRGLNASEAREEALRQFGDMDGTREACYESDWRMERNVRRKEYLSQIWQDAVHGIRQLRRRPAFAAVAILTLAVGVGANTAVFSAADHVLLRPLPYRDPGRAVTLWETERSSGTRRDVASGNYLEWVERTTSFETLGLAEPWGYDLTGDGPPVAVQAWLVSAGFFESLGVEPMLGRIFLPEDHTADSRVVILSEGLWRRRYGADVSLVGRTIELDSEAATVVGVLPQGIKYPGDRDIWGPKTFAEWELTNRSSSYTFAVARLRPGVVVEEAQADLDRVAAALAEEYPRTNANTGVAIVPLEAQVLGNVRPALLVLLGAVALVLLIASANVATLLLARGLERERELGVRAALGAGQPRLVRQLVTESVVLAALGGGLGLLLAYLGVDALATLVPPELPRAENIAIDGRVLLFAVLVSAFTALIFGLAPALRFSRPNLTLPLQGSSRAVTASRGRTRLYRALVISEIALALVLLIGAGLLVRSFQDLLDNDLGFVTEQRAVLQLFLWDQNPTPEQREQRVNEIEERFESTPGVDKVALTSALPFQPEKIDSDGSLTIEGKELPPGQDRRIYTTIVSGDYFEVMGIPLRAGRSFTTEDRMDSYPVAIINESGRRRYFPDEDPIGRRVTIGVMGAPLTREIVGVVGDVLPTTLESEPQPELFIPYSQSLSGHVSFVVRTDTDAAAMLPSLRAQIWQIDPDQSIYHAATVNDMISDTLVERRFHLVLLVSFSVIALLLAIIGIYGVMTFSTSRRTSEIGVRMAMGAKRTDVVTMILRDGIGLSVAGIALGIGGALLLTRFMVHMLYGVTPTDFTTFAAIALVMLIVSAAAAALPAYRAATADPLASLREE